jgi:hypothetical protein
LAGSAWRSWAGNCQQLGFHYVIRIKPDVWIQTAGFRGKLLDYPVKKGFCRLLTNVCYRKQNSVQQHLFVRWNKGLPKKRDECWFLMTDLQASAYRLSELYGKRMTAMPDHRVEAEHDDVPHAAWWLLAPGPRCHTASESDRPPHRAATASYARRRRRE